MSKEELPPGTYVGTNKSIFRGYFHFGYFIEDNFTMIYFGSVNEIADSLFVSVLMQAAKQEPNNVLPWYILFNPDDKEVYENAEWYKE